MWWKALQFGTVAAVGLILQLRRRRARAPAGNQCVHVLLPPVEEPYAGDVVFFHGLQPRGDYRNAWKDTWTAEGSCWPVDYLAPQLGQPVRVLSVAYDSRLLGGRCTPEALAESLFINLVLTEDVGQGRPVVLVGHSLGGLIIKQLCVAAHQRAVEHDAAEARDQRMARAFLKNVRLIAFFATPHAGSRAADFLSSQQRFKWSPVLEMLTTMSEKSEQLHAEFMRLSKQINCQWTLQSFGEREPVKKLVFNSIVVSEESARGDMPRTYMGCDGYNHIDIAAPTNAAVAPQCNRLVKLVKTALKIESDPYGHGPSVHEPYAVTSDAPGYSIWELQEPHHIESQVFISHGVQMDSDANSFATDLRQKLALQQIRVVDWKQSPPGHFLQHLETEASRSQVFVAILTKEYPCLSFPMRELQLATQSARLHGKAVTLVPVWLRVSRQPADDLRKSWEEAWAAWEIAKPEFISAATYRQNLETLWQHTGVVRDGSSTRILLERERSRMLNDAVDLIKRCGVQRSLSNSISK